METYSFQKRLIEAKLEEEKASIVWLQESLQKSDILSNNMLNILTSFEERLCKLEDTILPVHKETTDLQRRQENINNTLLLMDEVLNYHSVSSKLKPIVEEGPTGHLDQYLDTMKQIDDAIAFFQKNNTESIELSLLKSLNDTARVSLEKEFHLLLKRNSRVIPVSEIHNLTPMEGDEPLRVHHFTDKVTQDLCTIANWLTENRSEADFMSVYSQVRAYVLLQSLKGVEDDPGAFYESSKSTGKALLKTEHSNKMARKIMNKKATKQVIEVSRRTVSTATDVKDEDGYDHAETFITCTAALLKLMQSERDLLDPIIPEDKQIASFSKIVLDTLILYENFAEDVCMKARKSQTRLDHSAIQFILPALKSLLEVKPHFDVLLKMVNVDTRKKFVNVITLFKETGMSSLTEFVEKLKEMEKSNLTMPKDGTVHQITSNVAIFLEELVQYMETVAVILQDKSESSSPTDIACKYITKVLEALSRNLTNKSKTYDSSALQAIFMLNNYNYIAKGLRSIGLMSILQEHGQPNLERDYDEVIKDEMEVYERSWLRVRQHLQLDPSDKTLEAAGKGHLKEKHKQAIKDKFKGFNTELEEIQQIHRLFSVPDISLKKQIREKICESLLSNYEQFLKRYEGVSFTKNVDKYIKYDVERVRALVAGIYL